jgi:hypothetical protein
MDVNLMVLSPRMPICNALFARHAELVDTNTWAVVDIAVTGIFDQARVLQDGAEWVPYRGHEQWLLQGTILCWRLGI